MSIRIKNWKLAILSLAFISLFASLGKWQLSRAHEKKMLLKSFAERTAHPPRSAVDINQPQDWRFYRATLQGHFDNAHTMLLDNKIHAGKVGYEVYTPFIADQLQEPILIDRGFIPIIKNRVETPEIRAVEGNVAIMGMLNLPPKYFSLGQINESVKITWPMKIEYVNLAELSQLLNFHLYPYVMSLDPKSPYVFAMEWQVVTMNPEKNVGYAVQWFALAATLLILSVALNLKR